MEKSVVDNAHKKVAIIGAGIAGAVCAYELNKAGFDVTVFEREEHVGGRMHTHRHGGFIVNLGAVMLSNHYHLLRQYSDALGIPWAGPYRRTHHRVIRGGVPKPLGVAALSWRARLQLGLGALRIKWGGIKGNFFRLSETSPTLNCVSAQKYLEPRVGKEAIAYVLDPFMAGLHFYHLRDASPAMVITMFDSIVTDKHFGACYPAGGMQRIPEGLLKGIRVEHARVILEGRTVNNEEYDALVYACKPPQNILQVEYAPTITVTFSVPKDLYTDGTNVTYFPEAESMLLSSAIFEGWRKGGIAGDASFYIIYLHPAAARALMNESDAIIYKKIAAELARLLPEVRMREKDVAPLMMQRWPEAMPVFSTAHIERIREFEKTRQGKGGIWLTGDYMNSPWTEGAARSGKRVADGIYKSFVAGAF